jgi:hypothetical protein
MIQQFQLIYLYQQLNDLNYFIFIVIVIIHLIPFLFVSIFLIFQLALFHFKVRIVKVVSPVFILFDHLSL